ncbi:hypothetical protein DEA8626_02463 [Defluviimonas aquaemixtae]|uniref:Peptide methionine sulfoxide reductase n=1 Tax=Albidovulum aquaemixtae TaxID=1542388 RepID=A0A2R8BJ16_9RHOB|nr:hypothetical protein [Defluviimonas aquaemixtae]SPH23399.1 hypothetical protein DEA8626_02463 [Defluviimonas aquaemixtae]
MTDLFRAALDAIPESYSEGIFEGRRYRIEKAVLAEDRSVKLVARELGGRDYVSLNHYRLARGDQLRPCEMLEAKVRAFVIGVKPIEV